MIVEINKTLRITHKHKWCLEHCRPGEYHWKAFRWYRNLEDVLEGLELMELEQPREQDFEAALTNLEALANELRAARDGTGSPAEDGEADPPQTQPLPGPHGEDPQGTTDRPD